MNVVDSSDWLAYFADKPQAKYFHKQLCASSTLIVPIISIYEVFKVVFRETTENETLQAVAAMQKGKVIDLTTSLAMTALKLSITHNLPMQTALFCRQPESMGRPSGQWIQTLRVFEE